MPKLTLKECFLYPNAPIQMYYGRKKTIFFESLYHFLGYNYNFKKEIVKCKIQLRRLELTEGEKKEIQKLMITGSNIFNNVQSMLTLCYRDTKIKLIDKLREWNINIDFPEGDERFIYEK